MMVVPEDYSGVETFLLPSDVVAILGHSITCYSCVCGDARINKPAVSHAEV